MVPLLNVTCIVYRVETLWEASEMIGAMVLDGEGMISGLIMAPVVKSKLGKALLSTAPGEILLASLDSFDKILGAAEAAEIQTHFATSMAATKLVSKSFGENAGKITGKVLETTGSLGRIVWKIQKAMDPSFSMISGVVKNAERE
ncbi:senescence/dehydration-associated protein At3g51250-like [Brassica napus]|uniref:senescence/dehydration-associated protein At3g51250-like n=1 Tax=Brassica napus TaxID=3708 RepID=UPI002078ED7B|nr:senescence/dehydration-associated protein At3g51250-like [Brassica napus]